jgi:chemotaxis signal transduction protein
MEPSSPSDAPLPPRDPGPESSRRESGESSLRELATPSSRRRTSGERGQFACVFWLGAERYALDAVEVLEAISLTQLVPVPLSPSWLLGLTSLRGTPLPIVDLPAVLGLPSESGSRRLGKGETALVLRVDGILFGCRVERLEAVYPFQAARFEPKSGGGEHKAVAGLLEIGRRTAFPATLLDHAELSRRVNELRFRPKWERGPEGE